MSEFKKLRRSKSDSWLGGVCGGIGNYFNIDPLIVRIIWAATFFAYGAGFWIYLLCWILIPEE